MSQKSAILDRASQWDKICFPVASVPVATLLPEGYSLRATDRAQAIVGTVNDVKEIFAFQSKDYSLIPNSLLREVAESCLPNHRLDARYNDLGEFNLNLILPDEINIKSGTANNKVEDRLFKSLIMNNSYSGKTPFSLQGTAMKEHTVTKSGEHMRVSYYREVCENGLMGWADDFMNMDEYLTWLLNGKPTKHKRVEKVKDAELVEDRNTTTEREVETLVKRKFHHIGLDLELFKKQLCQIFHTFSNQAHGLEVAPTVSVFQKLAATPAPEQLATILAATGLPKALARAAMERMAFEEKQLNSEANLWLAYNAANFALFQSKNAIPLAGRFQKDEQLLHHFAELAM